MDTEPSTKSIGSSPLHRADGVTPSERYLKKLCDRTFLSLWSYPGVYRDQGQSGWGGDGKEVCDLLVVFREHVIIFSDKDCAFPDTGDLQLDWNRWYRRAVAKSAEQIWKAERWIRRHPNRLFINRACTQSFPIRIPDPSVAKFHRIVVAHGASERCRTELHGSGSLRIDTAIAESTSCDPGSSPFTVGCLGSAERFVHVLDDSSLGILLLNLDTIADFTEYLETKERVIRRGEVIVASSEQDLLAVYLRDMNILGKHDFVFSRNHNVVSADRDCWQIFTHLPQRLAGLRADEISYSWDGMIDRFCREVLEGDPYSYYSPPHIASRVESGEKILRYMASECRLSRRFLAHSLSDLVARTSPSRYGIRVHEPTGSGQPYYLFLVVPTRPSESHEEKRRRRLLDLITYCATMKLHFPDAQDILGIAVDTSDLITRSEDILYFDGRLWTPEHEEDARAMQIDRPLLTHLKLNVGVMEQFPLPPDNKTRSASTPAKGRARNQPCPCGSGKKHKKCCGR